MTNSRTPAAAVFYVWMPNENISGDELSNEINFPASAQCTTVVREARTGKEMQSDFFLKKITEPLKFRDEDAGKCAGKCKLFLPAA